MRPYLSMLTCVHAVTDTGTVEEVLHHIQAARLITLCVCMALNLRVHREM